MKDRELQEALHQIHGDVKEADRSRTITKESPGWAEGVKAGYEVSLHKQIEA